MPRPARRIGTSPIRSPSSWPPSSSIGVVISRGRTRRRRRGPRSRAATTARGRSRGTSSARSSRRAGRRACGGRPGAARRGASAGATGWASTGIVASAGVPSRGARPDPAVRPCAGRGSGVETAPDAPPVLVRLVRNGVEESVHRGDIVEVDVDRPDDPRAWRSGPPREPPVVRRSRSASSRSSRRAGWTVRPRAAGDRDHGQQPLGRGPPRPDDPGDVPADRRLPGADRDRHEGMPLDALTAARLARDGEQPGAIRHMCSGQHSVFVLLSRLNGWTPTILARRAPGPGRYRAVVATAFGTTPGSCARDRRLRRRDVRLPAARDRAGLRVPGRSRAVVAATTGGPRSRRLARHRARRDARPSRPGRGTP